MASISMKRQASDQARTNEVAPEQGHSAAVRSISFSGPMVRAILNGGKSQTRRVVKPQPDCDHDGEPYWYVGGYRGWRHRGITDVLRMGGNELRCPYGQPGDGLWVRETHAIFSTHGQHRNDGQRWGPWGGLPSTLSPDGTQIAYYREGFDRCDPGRWRPGIFLPRWASRIELRVTGVRLERLQEISQADSRAEGIAEFVGGWASLTDDAPQVAGATAKDGYRHLWDRIHGPGSWEVNPLVWVVEFDVSSRRT